MPATSTDLHVIRRAGLLAAGLTRSQIDARLAAGTLVKLGRFWYGDAQTPADIAASLARGAKLTCISALRHHGLWTPPFDGRHELDHRRTGAPATDVVGHGTVRRWDDDAPIIAPALALAHAARCLPIRDVAVLFESAANTGVVSMWQVEDILAALPQRIRKRLGTIEHRSQSGTETIVRRCFQRLRVPVRAQVQIEHVGRVDLLVGENLVIECDSRAHHTSEWAYAEDRRRDLQLVLQGYVVVRLTWADVMLHREATEFLLRELVRAGRHRRPASRGSR